MTHLPPARAHPEAPHGATVWSSKTEPLKKNLSWILGLVVLIWAVEVVNWTLDHQLSQFGILPRRVDGLAGIPLSPLLHGSIRHASLNTVPLLVLGGLVSLYGVGVFLRSSLVIVLLAGAAIWLFGRDSIHVGASGLIFGYFGFLVARGWYERKLVSILVAVLTVSLYGGIVWGILPSAGQVSWEGHLFGLLAGVLAARLETKIAKGQA